ncbi:MAG: hypothetical protein ABI759_11460 [Candidatus Solibacter sp.]
MAIPLCPSAVLPVSLDPLVARKVRTAKLQLNSEKDARYLILTDSYASLTLGMSMCQAGEETFLRVIALGPGRARQTFHRKLASCRENIELAEPGLTWSPETGTLRMHWLSAPQDREHQGEQTVQVAGDGTVQVR